MKVKKYLKATCYWNFILCICINIYTTVDKSGTIKIYFWKKWIVLFSKDALKKIKIDSKVICYKTLIFQINA